MASVTKRAEAGDDVDHALVAEQRARRREGLRADEVIIEELGGEGVEHPLVLLDEWRMPSSWTWIKSRPC